LASVNQLSRPDHLFADADDGGSGYNALQYAALCGHAKVLEVLLEFYPDDDGSYPEAQIVEIIAHAAIIAVLKGHADCAAALVSERNCQARRVAAVSHAVQRGLERAMVALIERGFHIDRGRVRQRKPLITASDLDRWNQFSFHTAKGKQLLLDAYDTDYSVFDDSPGANQIKWMLRQFDGFLLPDHAISELCGLRFMEDDHAEHFFGEQPW
jgi:hypothetical protein